ncbi:hypothetical protein Tco_1404258 [Tanacetum coccineum]
MSDIIDIKSVHTPTTLDAFCHKFYIPECIHPQLLGPGKTIHESLVGKIGVYTRFFEYANFRLPLSRFLVDILEYFRINLSQLSVIAAAKISHFEILCRVCNIKPTVGLFRYFYVNSKNKGWMSFSKCSDGSPVNPPPKPTEFSADAVAILVSHRAPFRKFPEPFLCLVGMSRYSTLDEDTYPRACGSAPIGPPCPARAESELEASVDKLFDEGDSTEQGDSTIGGGYGAEIEPVTAVEDTVAENVTMERPKSQCKKRSAVMNASGPSHPPKKLREDHGTSSRFALGSKSPSVLKEFLLSSILNAEVGVTAVATLPLITSSISATPKREGGDPTDFVTGPNVRTVGPAQRFVISSDSSHHSTTNASGAEVDSIIRSDVLPLLVTEAVITSHAVSAPSILVPQAKTKITSLIHPSIFHGSGSTETVRPDVAGPSYSVKQGLSMGSQELNTKTLHQVFVPQWNVLNNSLLDDSDEAEAAEATRLHIQVSAVEAAEKNDGLVDQVHSLETTCSRLRDQVSGYKQLKEQIKEFQDAQINIVNDKVAKLDVDLLEMALHMEEKFCPHLLTTISGRRWLLTHGLKLVVKCLNSPEYLAALRAAISYAIEKGMQSELRAGIDHGKEGRSLADVVAYAEADFNSALQRFCEVDFPLLAELSSHKDASPDFEQLMLSIHCSEDQVVLGETSLSFALSVANSWAKRIRKSVAEQHSSLADAMVPLVDPLSAENLTGEIDTSACVPTTDVVITALSITFASTSSIPPITIDDYEIADTDGQEGAQVNVQGDAASFPTVEFEKENLDTIP